MKINVDVSGNTSSTTADKNLRINDVPAVPPTPTPSPALTSQIQEVNPAAALPSPNRAAALNAYIPAPRTVIPSKSTMALLDQWKTTFPEYAHILTIVSKDDDTTARGWEKLDINKLVADAGASNDAKKSLAKRISDWIRDAWTGPTPIGNLAYSQVWGDERLRLQFAANLIDYIDTDDTPTVLDDYVIPGFADPVPIIGIEKLPYITGVEFIYTATSATAVPPTGTANVALKVRLRFLNMFEIPLNLTEKIGRVEIKGVPVLDKNNAPFFDVETQTFVIQATDLKAVKGSGVQIQPGVDGTTNSGARTFETTNDVVTKNVTYTIKPTNDERPRLEDGKVEITVYSPAGDKIDVTAIGINPKLTGYNNASPSTGDFLKDNKSTAAISLTYGLSGNTELDHGDPRFRARLVNERWRNITRTDPARVAFGEDKSETNLKSYAFDWFDQTADRPFAFIRNQPLLNIGELGNVSAAQYPWRTVYLQQPERPSNTAQTGPKDDIPTYRRQAVDYVLLDLFRAGGPTTRRGAININSQQQMSDTTATPPSPVHLLRSLFLGLPVGTALPDLNADRLSTGVNLLLEVNTESPPSAGSTGSSPRKYRFASVSNKRIPLEGANKEIATPDKHPARPYFQPAELASTLSRLISGSEASNVAANSAQSRVIYSILRSDPSAITDTKYYRTDIQAEQAFREVSSSTTTRGNVFRVLYVGQAIKDQKDASGQLGAVEKDSEIVAEYLGEAFVERQPIFAPQGSNPDAKKTSDSRYTVIAQRPITE